jgi:hypothetical protein
MSSLKSKVNLLEKIIKEQNPLSWEEWAALVRKDSERTFKDWTSEELVNYALTGKNPEGKQPVIFYDEIGNKVYNFFKSLVQQGWSKSEIDTYLITGEVPQNDKKQAPNVH